MRLAEALAYAHKKGILHRDIKPANVMIDGDGEPHLMDFGLARLEASSEKLTQDGTVMGTPAYMSPEQAKGIADDISTASDQYSLGATLYEMLCGELPFNGPPEVVIFNVVQTDPLRPISVDPAIPRDLETICLKAMAKDSAARYVDCQELAADLRRWLDDEPIHARRMNWTERSIRWCRHNPAIAGMTMFVCTVVMLALTLTTWQWRIAKQEETNAIEARDEAQRQFYFAQMNLAQRDWESDAIGQLLERLDATRPEQMGSDDLRGFEWHFWYRRCHAELSTLKGHTGVVASVAFSPDGTRIVSGILNRLEDAVTSEICPP